MELGRHWLTYIMACHLLGTKPLSKPVVISHHSQRRDFNEKISKLTKIALKVIIIITLLAFFPGRDELIQRGQVTHICIDRLTKIGSDYGLSPGWC